MRYRSTRRTREEVGGGAEDENAGRVDAELRERVGCARQMRKHRLREDSQVQEDIDTCAHSSDCWSNHYSLLSKCMKQRLESDHIAEGYLGL